MLAVGRCSVQPCAIVLDAVLGMGPAHLARCVAQVLIVHGENDALVPAWNSQRLAALLPGCSVKVFPETGHMPMEEKPHQFVATVSQFLGAS